MNACIKLQRWWRRTGNQNSVCPFKLEYISTLRRQRCPLYRRITAGGLPIVYSLVELAQYLISEGHFVCPLTREPFTTVDGMRIDRYLKQLNLSQSRSVYACMTSEREEFRYLVKRLAKEGNAQEEAQAMQDFENMLAMITSYMHEPHAIDAENEADDRADAILDMTRRYFIPGIQFKYVTMNRMSIVTLNNQMRTWLTNPTIMQLPLAKASIAEYCDYVDNQLHENQIPIFNVCEKIDVMSDFELLTTYRALLPDDLGDNAQLYENIFEDEDSDMSDEIEVIDLTFL